MGDNKEPSEGSEETEQINVANLNEIDEAYVCIVNYDAAVEDLSETKGKFEIVLYDDGTVHTVQYWNSGWTITYTDGTYNEATADTAPDSNTTTTIIAKS